MDDRRRRQSVRREPIDQLLELVESRATYSLMVSLLPATATAIGIVVLAQIPSPVEVCGVALVIGGVAAHREPPRSLQS
jgi:inner membrane transporter RhtA